MVDQVTNEMSEISLPDGTFIETFEPHKLRTDKFGNIFVIDIHGKIKRYDVELGEWSKYEGNAVDLVITSDSKLHAIDLYHEPYTIEDKECDCRVRFEVKPSFFGTIEI